MVSVEIFLTENKEVTSLSELRAGDAQGGECTWLFLFFSLRRGSFFIGDVNSDISSKSSCKKNLTSPDLNPVEPIYVSNHKKKHK